MAEFMEIINSLGFPMAMVLYFIWDKKKSMDVVLQAINNNTVVLNRLMEKLDVLGLPIEGGVVNGE